MRMKLAAVMATALSLVAVAASANTTLGWYVAGDIGVHDMQTQKLTVQDVTLVSHDETDEGGSSSESVEKTAPANAVISDEEDISGGVYGLETKDYGAAFLRAGNQLTPHWRAELEVGQRQGKIYHGIAGDDSYGDESDGRGKLDLTSVMANVLYDIAPDSRVHPYVGAGLGAVQVKTDYTGAYEDSDYSATYSIHAKRTVGAWQAIAGLAWQLSDRATLDLTYRYLETRSFSYAVNVDTTYYTDSEYDPCDYSECGKATPKTAKVAGKGVGPVNARVLNEDSYQASLNGKIRDHSLTIGLRWAFGAPPASGMSQGSPYAPPASSEPAAPADYSAPGPVVAPVSPVARRSFTVYFPFDTATITADGQAVMTQAAQQAVNSPNAPVSVIGHADTSGSGAYNIKLSQKRARMVADGLVQLGVPASAITTDWKGESQPAVPTGDGVKNAENRRATITIGE